MHWYDKETGEPRHYIDYAGKRDGKRPTTIRDARKHGFVPSVTTILNVLDKPALNRWKLNQMLEAAINVPPCDNWTSEVWKESKRVSREAMEKGKAIHNAIENYLLCKRYSPTFDVEVFGAMSHIKAQTGKYHRKDWTVEKSFSTESYGGRIDLHNDEWIIDWKTKDFDQEDIDSGKVKGWPEQCRQLVAYDKGLSKSVYHVPDPRRLGNLFISRTIPGLCHFWEWEDEDYNASQWQVFQHCLSIWQIENKWITQSA